MVYIPSGQKDMCDEAAKHVPVPEWQRACGHCACGVCHAEYFSHPQAIPHTWLRVLCDGRYVKL